MTNKVQKEETPNPYNAKKDWHVKDDKPFISSENMYLKSHRISSLKVTT